MESQAFAYSTPSYVSSSSSSSAPLWESGSWMPTMTPMRWVILILVLAFLGFNIFAFMAKGTQTIVDILGPLVKQLFGITLTVTGEAVSVSAEGAKTVVHNTADAVETGLTAVQNLADPHNIKATHQSQQRLAPPALTPQKQIKDGEYEADDANSTIQGRSGWCFIGNDRGYRSCAQIGVNDTCMSGEIFPSHEICMNPNLRP